MKRLRIFAVLVAISAAFITAGCSASTDSSRASGTQEFTFGVFTESSGLDPIHLRAGGRGSDTEQATAIFDRLFYQDPETHELKMQIAESLTSQDDVVWDLKLNDGVKFTDGTPYDAEAVKFNWTRVAEPSNGAWAAAGMSPVKSLEVVDPLTLRITLKSEYATFPLLVDKYLNYIGSPTAIRELGDEFAQKPVGAGPFMVDSWLRDSDLVLTKNPQYWIAGQPHLDKLVFQQIIDDEQRYNSFVSGELTGAFAGPNTLYGQRAKDAGFTVETEMAGGGIVMMFNTKEAPLDNPEIRKAVAKAVDLAKVNEVANQGTNEAPETLFPEGSPFYSDVKLPTSQPDPAFAQNVFDKYAAEKGGPLEFAIQSTPATATQFEMLQAQLNAYENVNVTLSTVQATALYPTVAAGDFQAAAWANYGDDPDTAMYEYYHAGDRGNFTRIDDPALTEAFEAGRSSGDTEGRAAAYLEAQERIADLVPEVFIQRWTFNYLLQSGVENFSMPASGVPWGEVRISG